MHRANLFKYILRCNKKERKKNVRRKRECEKRARSTHRSSVRSCHDLPRWRTETERREAGLSMCGARFFFYFFYSRSSGEFSFLLSPVNGIVGGRLSSRMRNRKRIEEGFDSPLISGGENLFIGFPISAVSYPGSRVIKYISRHGSPPPRLLFSRICLYFIHRVYGM